MFKAKINTTDLNYINLNGKWVVGYYWENGLGNHFIRAIKEQFDLNKIDYYIIKDYEIDVKTLCYGTGFRDDNSKEIFSNDIVRFHFYKSYKDVFIWYNKEVGCLTPVSLDDINTNGFDFYNFDNKKYDYETFCLQLKNLWDDYSKIEVVGNYFDNYEMIQKALEKTWEKERASYRNMLVNKSKKIGINIEDFLKEDL